MLSAEKVKTFHHFYPCAEPPVQQCETPHPPPAAPPEGRGEENPDPDPLEQQKEDISFFTSDDPHLGHKASFAEAFTESKSENLSLHFRQIYSYIGITSASLQVYKSIDYSIRPQLI